MLRNHLRFLEAPRDYKWGRIHPYCKGELEELAEKALTGIKVLECAQFVSGPFCAKLMADLGAEVTKVEPPGVGDVARSRGPFPNDVPHPERSALFLYLNTNKQSVTLNLEKPKGRELFKELVKEVDVLVEDTSPQTMPRLGLGYNDLKAINPQLVMTSITPFGETGPYSKYKSYYLNTFHAGGQGYTLPGGLGWLLFSDREPLKAGGFVGEYYSGVGAAVATVACLYGRELTAMGQHIDCSQQEILLGLMRHDFNKYNDGWIETRASRSFPLAGLMQCKDGFVQVMPLYTHLWDRLLDAMGNPDWSKEERYQFSRVGFYPTTDEPSEITKDRNRVNDLLAEWALKHTKDEIYYEVQAKGCPVGKVCTPEDIINDKQLQAREFFVEIDHPETGKMVYPGWPYKYSETPATIRRRAPLLGEHNEQIYCQRLGHSKAELVRMRQAQII